MPWLIEEQVANAMASAPALTTEQVEKCMAGNPMFSDGPNPVGNADRVMSIVGGVAQINVVGVMTSSPDFLAMLFGGGNVLYGDIITAINASEADPNVKETEFYLDTPGGEAQPVVGLGDLITRMKKPTTARVVNAQSAGYWVAAACDKVVATTRASKFGSIGAVASFRRPSQSFTIDVTSTDAPNKRPDPESEAGQRVIREQNLDPLHEMFASAVATGRGTTVEDVNQNFGRGGSLYAEKALEVGMIDEITQAPTQSVAPADDNQPNALDDKGVQTMDLEQLKKDHPSVYAQAMEEGRKEERNRVAFHASMGIKNGAEAVALKACQDGTDMNDGTVLSEYMSAGMNKREVDARVTEEAELADNTPASADLDDAAKEKANVNKAFSLAGLNAVDVNK